jgi:hypothetical protein
LPEQSKLSRPILFGTAAVNHQVKNIVVDVVPQNCASKKVMVNPYAKTQKASANPYAKKQKTSANLHAKKLMALTGYLKETIKNPHAKKPKTPGTPTGSFESVWDLFHDVIDSDDESEASMNEMEASMEDVLRETIQASEDGNHGFGYEHLKLNE